MTDISFQIASDLHIEYKNDAVPDPLYYITPNADVLILAGDIGSLYKPKQLEEFLRRISEYFKLVVYVPGNHEYYRIDDIEVQDMASLNWKLRQIENNIENLNVLSCQSIIIGDICIAGCTLWSSLKINIPKFLVRINGINDNIYNQMYQDSLFYLNNTIKNCREKKLKLIVVTHYAPTYIVLEGSKKKEKFYSLYASNLEHLMKKENMLVWVYGHVHNNYDYITEGGTRLIGNQVGKPKDCINNYNKSLVLTV